jgi:bifunctional enzyme CysN/CysC
MHDAGLVVLVALVSPFATDRRAAKELFEPGQFLEVFIDTPLEVAQQRDPKGLYAKAAAGAIPNMTGVGQDYEVPTAPDLVLDGTGDLDTIVATLTAAILREESA